MKSTNVKTQPYPGFPTDMQPQMTVLLALAQGTSNVTESVTDSRFQYTEELRRMGADIVVNGKMAIVNGGKTLSGTSVRCPDLRAGAALVIAGLAAEGVTYVEHIHFIERGYEGIIRKLTALGANIRRVDD